jgi:hypothetical protein
MKTTSILHALAACALVAIGAPSATAQTTTQAGKTSAATTSASAASTPWSAMPTGKYQLNIHLPEGVMSAMLTIRDSAGVPAATFLGENDPEAHPMQVTVKGTELYLNADAPKGPMEIVLLRQGEQLDGRWSYAGGNGTLTGKVEK